MTTSAKVETQTSRSDRSFQTETDTTTSASIEMSRFVALLLDTERRIRFANHSNEETNFTALSPFLPSPSPTSINPQEWSIYLAIEWLELIAALKRSLFIVERQLQSFASLQNFESDADDDDWTLNADQMVFMLQYHNAVETAFENDDMEFLDELEASEEFQAVFGDMSFDEAYDRYETMLEGDGVTS